MRTPIPAESQFSLPPIADIRYSKALLRQLSNRFQTPSCALQQRSTYKLRHEHDSACCAIAAAQRAGRNAQHRRRNVTVSATASSGSTARGEPLLVLEGVRKSHDGDTILFDDVDFTICRGERIAVVGPNGSGKTTLLRIMAGVDEADAGAVKRIGGVRVGYLAQDPYMNPASTVLEAVLASEAEAARVVQDYERILAGQKTGAHTPEELAAAHARMDQFNAWALDAEAREVMQEMGCGDLQAKISDLSGGQHRRASLAAALLSSPDLLVLDEPTNHLDLAAIQWLEQRLTTRGTSLILVTHDRFFLEATCTGILELDRDGTHLHQFGGKGSYQRFREARAARRHAAAEAAADARTVLRKESEWMLRQPKARSTKSRSRIDNYLQLLEKSRAGPRRDDEINFADAKGKTAMARQGKKVLRVEGLTGGVWGGRTLIRDFWYDFEPGERIGIVGPNGAGKSTLLNLLAGLLPLTAGTREEGDTTVMGFFTQQSVSMRPTSTLIGYLRDEVFVAPETAETAGKTITPEMLLERLGFPRNMQHREVGMLSGGQKRRLQLAGVLRARPNLLFLDEASNDLDLTTIEAVENLMREFKGVLLVVSHDRAFLEATTDKLFVLQGDGLVRLFDGSYYEYLDIMKQQDQERKKEAARRAAAEAADQASGTLSNGSGAAVNGSGGSSAANGSKPARPLKLGFREKQELERLEQEVDHLGARRTELDQQIAACATAGDFEALQKATAELATVAEQIDAKTERWLELEELAEACA